MLAIKAVLATVLRYLEFDLELGLDIMAYAAPPAMGPKPGILMRARRRGPRQANPY
jgi:hypothetical protein